MNSENTSSSPVPVALLDANVLFPAPLRDFLMHLAITGAARVHWSTRIEQEWTSNLIAKRPDLDPQRVERTARTMNAALPDAMVKGFEELESRLILPDLDDAHVLAAAIHVQTDLIVTKNLKDFPPNILNAFHIEAQHPDTFVLHLLEIQPKLVLEALHNQRSSLKNPPLTLMEILSTLETLGLIRSVQSIRSMLEP